MFLAILQVLNTLPILTHLILTQTTQSRYYYKHCFTNEEAQAQKD